MSGFVTCTIDQGVALVTLNRPDRMNAINTEMGQAFDRTMVEIGLDSDVRVVVLTGAGERAFCAGADMQRLQGISEGTESAQAPQPKVGERVVDQLTYAPAFLRARYTLPMAIRQPVIAAVNGVVAGVGLALMTASDIRFASPNAAFAAGFPQRGLAAESGVAWSLTAIIGRGAASEFLLSGRKMNADEAHRLGLVTAVHDQDKLLSHALAYAQEIAANNSPRSTEIIKRQLRLAVDQTFEEALQLASDETQACLKSEDFHEGVASFREKRQPKFPALK